jgi:Fe-Mn family superoxide dismutase
MEGLDVVSILRKAYGTNQGLFNNAAQAYNHAFYWNCMKPNGGGKPTGKLAELIDTSFGSYDEFKTQFINAGATAFGSGWAWLVYTPSGLKVWSHYYDKSLGVTYGVTFVCKGGQDNWC